jgi:hypothetical protein
VRSTYQADQAASSHQAFYNSTAGWLGFCNATNQRRTAIPTRNHTCQQAGRLVDKYDCGWGWRFFADSWHYTQGTTLALKHLAIQYPSFELLLDSDEASSQRCLLALLSLETREILHLAWYTGDKMMDILAADIYRANNLYYLQLNNIETATGGNYDAPFTVAEFSAVCAACPKLRALSCVLPDQNIFADRRNLQSGP